MKLVKKFMVNPVGSFLGRLQHQKLLLNTRLDRFCMGKFQTQKLIRPVVLKDADTHEEQPLFYVCSKF
jgi:hypothetical protein